jgi:hypothetical protein
VPSKEANDPNNHLERYPASWDSFGSTGPCSGFGVISAMVLRIELKTLHSNFRFPALVVDALFGADTVVVRVRNFSHFGYGVGNSHQLF